MGGRGLLQEQARPDRSPRVDRPNQVERQRVVPWPPVIRSPPPGANRGLAGQAIAEKGPGSRGLISICAAGPRRRRDPRRPEQPWRSTAGKFVGGIGKQLATALGLPRPTRLRRHDPEGLPWCRGRSTSPATGTRRSRTGFRPGSKRPACRSPRHLDLGGRTRARHDRDRDAGRPGALRAAGGPDPQDHPADRSGDRHRPTGRRGDPVAQGAARRAIEGIVRSIGRRCAPEGPPTPSSSLMARRTPSRRPCVSSFPAARPMSTPRCSTWRRPLRPWRTRATGRSRSRARSPS